MNEAPGERFKFVFDLPRREQIARLRVLIDALPLDLSDAELNERLADIEYDLRVIREAIWCAAYEQTRANNPKPQRTTAQPTTLEDLI